MQNQIIDWGICVPKKWNMMKLMKLINRLDVDLFVIWNHTGVSISILHCQHLTTPKYELCESVLGIRESSLSSSLRAICYYVHPVGRSEKELYFRVVIAQVRTTAMKGVSLFNGAPGDTKWDVWFYRNTTFIQFIDEIYFYLKILIWQIITVINAELLHGSWFQ